MANRRKALEGHCLDLGYKFKVARRYLDTRTLNSLSVLENLWRSNRDETISDQDIIQSYVAIREGNNHRLSELLRKTLEELKTDKDVYQSLVSGISDEERSLIRDP